MSQLEDALPSWLGADLRSALSPDGLYRPSRDEVLLGAVPGFGTALPLPRVEGEPREVLESLLCTELAKGPCAVPFSGGRDSSALLALATHVARREGLPLPRPVTFVFGTEPHARDEQLQIALIEQLQLTDWVRLPGADVYDVLGLHARAGLQTHGLLWSPLVHAQDPLLTAAAGHTLISGEGGDEVLGPWRYGMPVRVARQVRARHRPRLVEVRGAAGSVRPDWWLREANKRAQLRSRPWLTGAGRDLVADLLRRSWVPPARRFDADRRQARTTRGGTLGLLTMQALADGKQPSSRYSFPFLDRRFVGSLAQAGGARGWTTRTEMMWNLVGDLLPPALLGRNDKANFGPATMGPRARAFARRCTGLGIDADLVDVERLRARWLTGERTYPGLLLLQQAWLAEEAGSP